VWWRQTGEGREKPKKWKRRNLPGQRQGAGPQTPHIRGHFVRGGHTAKLMGKNGIKAHRGIVGMGFRFNQGKPRHKHQEKNRDYAKRRMLKKDPTTHHRTQEIRKVSHPIWNVGSLKKKTEYVKTALGNFSQSAKRAKSGEDAVRGRKIGKGGR